MGLGSGSGSGASAEQHLTPTKWDQWHVMRVTTPWRRCAWDHMSFIWELLHRLSLTASLRYSRVRNLCKVWLPRSNYRVTAGTAKTLE